MCGGAPPPPSSSLRPGCPHGARPLSQAPFFAPSCAATMPRPPAGRHAAAAAAAAARGAGPATDFSPPRQQPCPTTTPRRRLSAHTPQAPPQPPPSGPAAASPAQQRHGAGAPRRGLCRARGAPASRRPSSYAVKNPRRRRPPPLPLPTQARGPRGAHVPGARRTPQLEAPRGRPQAISVIVRFIRDNQISIPARLALLLGPAGATGGPGTWSWRRPL
jgi:hypothetical protein